MAVTDRWHKTYPDPKVDHPCKCGTAKRPLYPTAEHPRPARDGKPATGGGKRWQVRYRDDEGKQKSKNFTLKEGKNSEIHADAFDIEVNAQLNTDSYTDPNAGKVTLRAYAEEWRKGQVTDPATLIKLDGFLKNWVYSSSIADLEMARIAKRPSLIQAWVSWMNETLESSTVRWSHTTLSSIFISAVDDGVVSKNPCRARSIKLPIVIQDEVVPLTLTQVEAIRADLPDRYKAIVDLGAGCGLRQGELFGLAVNDIDFLRGQVKILRQIKVLEDPDTGRNVLVFDLPKGDKVRTVPLEEGVALRLASHIKEFPPVDVALPWKTVDGKPKSVKVLFFWAGKRKPGPMDRNSFNHVWRSAREAAGLPNDRRYGMHVLRHTFASASLAGGVDLKRLSVDLGHANVGITAKIYTHLMPNGESRVRAAINAFFAGQFEDASALDVPAAQTTPSAAESEAALSQTAFSKLRAIPSTG